MVSAKSIRLAPIPGREGNAFIREHHYSGGSAVNAQLNIGVFLADRLEGAMQFGPPLDRRKMLGLVEGTEWGGVLELNRMAFSNQLPPNSESRALGVAMRLLRQHAPQVKWVLSFADATQCGDGTIYRASGFVLTAIKRSDNLARFPNGEVIHKMRLESAPTVPREVSGGRSYYEVTEGRYDFTRFVNECGGEVLPGFQLRYIRFIDPAYRARLTVPEIPFSAIADAGAGMYLGEKR